jgi:hypothetical protein
MTANESNYNEKYQPFSLNQFEEFKQSDSYTEITALMSLDAYVDVEKEQQGMATTEERDAMLESIVRHAEMSCRIDGFKIENKHGQIVDTILPDSFDTAQRAIIQGGAGNIIRVKLNLANESASTLQKLSKDYDCLFGDVLTVGIATRSAVKRHYSNGHHIIAVLSNTDKRLAILPLS